MPGREKSGVAEAESPLMWSNTPDITGLQMFNKNSYLLVTQYFYEFSRKFSKDHFLY